MIRAHFFLAGLVGLLAAQTTAADDQQLRTEAQAALRKATQFFVEQVAVEGGYVYRCSEDLQRREGERAATPSMVWVQPPGTPTVGLAYLAAYEGTGDAYYLDAARKTAEALVRGQLRSGGWGYEIEFNPALRKNFNYRVEPETPKGFNVTTLDDNNTQEPIRLLMRLDAVLKQQDAIIHEAATYALDKLLAAQYPNGAWPQRFSEPADPSKFPVKPASYPETWSRTFPGTKYNAHYTFNDNAMGDVIEVLLEAGRIYDQPKYRAAAERGGDFILLSQMPDPQPAWAQQYDADMHPAWARKFEPPSVTGGESVSNLKTLLILFRETGNTKFLEPIPRALAYLEASRLPDGRLARFYELKTNKPLYFTKDYVLTYSDADMPTHYGFKVSARFDVLRKEYDKQRARSAADFKTPAKPKRPQAGNEMMKQVKAAIAALDERGRWLEPGTFKTQESKPGEKIIVTATFIQNVKVLSAFLGSRPAD